MTARIIWLASYPKSGNTWVRCLLDSLGRSGEAPDLARLGETCPNAATRHWIEGVLELPTSDLTPEELIAARIEAARSVGISSGGHCFLKVHDRYDAAMFPSDLSAGAVLILRDPRDVALSWAAHLGRDVDTAIGIMGCEGYMLGWPDQRLSPHLPQTVGSWSEHAVSWLDQEAIPRLVLHYEDLLARPLEEANRLVDFLGLGLDGEVVSRAVRSCGFERLQGLEAQGGFGERPAAMPAFFRQGRAGSWRRALSADQVTAIELRHGPVMRRLGYALSGE